MKNLICLFSIVFATVLMNTSCTKPTDDTPIPVAITVNDLVGNWKFSSLTPTGGAALTDSLTLWKNYSHKGKISLKITLSNGVGTNCVVDIDWLNQDNSSYDAKFDATNNTLSFPGYPLPIYDVTFENSKNILVLIDSKSFSSTITYRLHK